MDAVVFLTCADEVRRTSITESLARAGLGVTAPFDEPTLLHIVADDEQLTLRYDGQVLIQLANPVDPDDIAVLAKLAVQLASLRTVAHGLDDAESVGVIASLVAHDARNALVPVVFAADVLVSQAPASLANVARVIADGTSRVANILRRVVDFQNDAPEPTDVNAVILELSGTLHTMMQGRAQLTTRIESPLPSVQLARPAIERILLNLVLNGRDACERDGRVIVSTERRNGSVLIVVEDNGIGMDERTRARALEPFFTTKSHKLGAGLGLASVARTVKSAGGSVVVISSQELGTRVEVSLPPAV